VPARRISSLALTAAGALAAGLPRGDLAAQLTGIQRTLETLRDDRGNPER
jgi:hypothetical protein